jgi:hypothetical protein
MISVTENIKSRFSFFTSLSLPSNLSSEQNKILNGINHPQAIVIKKEQGLSCKNKLHGNA